MQGWIKLHRKILEWEWFIDNATFKVFIYLILKANTEDKCWQGVKVKRGQLITSRLKMSAETGLSEQQIRTAISKLIETNEITSRSTNKFTLITICKYECYQSTNDNEQPANQPTNQPAINQQNNQQSTSGTTTTKEDKNIRNKENIEVVVTRVPQFDIKPIEEYMSELSNDRLWVENVCMCNHIDLNDFPKRMQEFLLECKCNGHETQDSRKDAQQHFQNWLRIRLQAERKEQRYATPAKPRKGSQEELEQRFEERKALIERAMNKPK